MASEFKQKKPGSQSDPVFGGGKGNINSSLCASISPKAIQYDKTQLTNIMKTHERQPSCFKHPNQCSFVILLEYLEVLKERVNVEDQSVGYKLNSPAKNPVTLTSIITTTSIELPLGDTNPSKPPNEFRLRGGQELDFSLIKKSTPSESKNQTTIKTSNKIFSIKTRGDEFSLRFHNSSEEIECSLNDGTKSSPALIQNMIVVSKNAEMEARRSSASLCQLKTLVSGALSNSSSSSSDSDKQRRLPCCAETPNLPLNNSERRILPLPPVKRKRMQVVNDITDWPIKPPCMACCCDQPNITHTKANILGRPRSCTKYQSGGRPATCKCYKAPTSEEYLAMTMNKIYACRTDRRPKQFIYGRVRKAEREPTGMRVNSKTNLITCAEDSNGSRLSLNFRQICVCLKTARLQRRAELLQAIRWRLTKGSMEVRQKTLQDISNYDLFKLHCRCGSRSFLEDLLWPLNTTVPNALQESTARLLNAIVSTQAGRNYVGGVSVIETLVWGETIYGMPFSYNDRDFVSVQLADQLMATMMKLSLNPAQRTDMIHKGLLRWLIRHMEDVDYASATAYHQENMFALLMILVGHPGSRELVGEKCTQVLSLLIRYMQHSGEESAQPFQRYIRLALIDLLHSARLVTCAKQMNFPQIVCQMIKKCSDSHERKELETIAELLERTHTSVLNSLSAYKTLFKENQFFQEPDIDSSDSVEAAASEGGEQLLTSKFSQPTGTTISKTFRKDQSHIPGDVHLATHRMASVSKLQKTQSTPPSSFPVSLPDITSKNYRSETKTTLRQRSASPKRTTIISTSHSSLSNSKNLSDPPTVTFSAKMAKTKPTKPTGQNQAHQTSTSVQPSIAIATEQPRHISKSTDAMKGKPRSKTKSVDVVPKPLGNTGVKAKIVELSSGHENKLETLSVQSPKFPSSVPETRRKNSCSSFKEEQRSKTSPRTNPSSKSTNTQKSKREANSSVDVVKKQELMNCEKCGFAKILYMVDRCTSMVDISRARSVSEQLDWIDGNRLSVLSDSNLLNSNADEVIKHIISSETFQVEVKTLAKGTQFRASSDSVTERNPFVNSQLKAPEFQDEFCETCGRPMQTAEDDLHHTKEEPIVDMAQLKFSERTAPSDQKSSPQETILRQHDYAEDKLKPRYYETDSSAQGNQSGVEYLAKSLKPQQVGPSGRFNDEECNFDCSARKFSDRQCASCGRPNDRQRSAPLVSFKSSSMFDSAALPYQRTDKSPDIENYGRSMQGQYDNAERNRWSRDPMEKFQKEFIAQPNERDTERKNEKPSPTKRLSQSPVRPKCHKETCSQNCCRHCSRRNTEPKPIQQDLLMNARQIRSKSKSPSERSTYPQRSEFSFPPQQFDKCCQSTQTSCSANAKLSQSQGRISATVKNTSISTQTVHRSGSVDSIYTNHGNRLELATMPGRPRKN